MEKLIMRPMSSSEFDAFRMREIHGYAAEQVRAGNWTEDESATRSAEQTDSLLPLGVETPGTLLLIAETPDGVQIGHVWVTLQRQHGSGSGAWIYDIEIESEHRGKGFGRALLMAAEEETARHGISKIGLNVFGSNKTARSLYESAGYQVASTQMYKELPLGGSAE
jgi:ribosomal protein S18 acetylase RimI-like enzyme